MALTSQQIRRFQSATPGEIAQAQSLIARGRAGAARGDPRLQAIVNVLLEAPEKETQQFLQELSAKREQERQVELSKPEERRSVAEPTLKLLPIPETPQQAREQFFSTFRERAGIEESRISTQPFLEERVVGKRTVTIGREGEPVKQIFFVGETGIGRRATLEEEQFFREQSIGRLEAVTQEEEVGKGLLFGFLKAQQLGEFEPLGGEIRKKRRVLVQREEPGFKTELIGFGLGLGASAITTAEFAKSAITQPIKTIESIPESLIFATEFLGSGAATKLIKTEPGFVTGFVAGEVAQFKVSSKVLKGKKKAPVTEQFKIDFIEPQPITRTPLSETFAKDFFIGGEKDFLLKEFKPQKTKEFGLKRFKEEQALGRATEFRLKELEAPKLAFGELIEKESKIFVSKKGGLPKDFLEFKPSDLGLKRFKEVKKVKRAKEVGLERIDLLPIEGLIEKEAKIFISRDGGLPKDFLEFKPKDIGLKRFKETGRIKKAKEFSLTDTSKLLGETLEKESKFFISGEGKAPKPFFAIEPIDIGLKRFKEIKRVRKVKEVGLERLDLPRKLLGETLEKEAKFFISKEGVAPKPLFSIEPFDLGLKRFKQKQRITKAKEFKLAELEAPKKAFGELIEEGGIFVEREGKAPQPFLAIKPSDLGLKGLKRIKSEKIDIGVRARRLKKTRKLREPIEFEITKDIVEPLEVKAGQQQLLLLEKPKQIQKQIQKEFKIVAPEVKRRSLKGIPRSVGGEGLTEQQLAFAFEREKQIFGQQQQFQQQIQVGKPGDFFSQLQINLQPRLKDPRQFSIQTGRLIEPRALELITAQKFRDGEKQVPFFKTLQKQEFAQAQPQIQTQVPRQDLGFGQGFAQSLAQALKQPQGISEIPKQPGKEILRFGFPTPFPSKKPLKKIDIDFGFEDPFSILRAKRGFKRTVSLGAILQKELTGFAPKMQSRLREQTGLVERSFRGALPKPVKLPVTFLTEVKRTSSKKKKKKKKK